MDFTYDRGLAALRRPADHVPTITIIFDLLRQDRRTGEVTGEVEVRVGEGTGFIVSGIRVNLTSDQARTRLAAICAKRLQDLSADDWSRLIEEACVRTIRAFRAGRPPVLISEIPPPPQDTGALLGPLLAPSGPTIWFGDGGTGKSLLALAAAASLAGGEALLGFRPTTKLRIALLDFEWDAWQHHMRLRQLLGENMPEVLYVPCQSEGPLVTQVERLRRICLSHEIQFVIVDSAGYACAGPPEEAEVALGFFQALARLEVSSLLLAHVNRTGDHERPFGSVFWHNSARKTWFIQRTKEVGPELVIGLFNKKANASSFESPLGYRITFGGTQIGISRVSKEDLAATDMAAEIPLRDRVTALLRRGAKTLEEVVEELGETNPETVRRCLYRHFHRLPDRRWGLPAREEAE